MFCEVWIEVVNNGGATHVFHTGQQALVDDTGRRYRPDAFAMAVRRQPEAATMGGHQLLWMQLWFDAPRNAHVMEIRLAGDTDPAAYQSTVPAPQTPGGVPFRLS
jgi:hypothetical protein